MLEAIIIVVCAAVCIGAAAYAWWMENGPDAAARADGPAHLRQSGGVRR